MSTSKLINVFCWKPEPGNYWRCSEGVSGITVDAPSKDEAIAEFNNIWTFRTPVQWIYEAPKRPRRPDDPKPVSAAIDEDTDAVKFHRLLLRSFHPDLHGSKKRWSADQVVAIINERWTEATRVGNG